ncbi:hypothetical protein ACFYYB_41435 [Streptomyces sp. NPDC002886]|uniref:hypothetical protein n=1 Tax=Streptomyces sp. NPDC002886 TaxID=3364667 RepID=UPI003683B30D
MTMATRELGDHRRPKGRREGPRRPHLPHLLRQPRLPTRQQWRSVREWRGWTGAAPFWLNAVLLLLTPFTTVTLLAQVGIIAGLTAIGGLARHLWSGDYGHAAIHSAAVLMGAAAVTVVVV